MTSESPLPGWRRVVRGAVATLVGVVLLLIAALVVIYVQSKRADHRREARGLVIARDNLRAFNAQLSVLLSRGPMVVSDLNPGSPVMVGGATRQSDGRVKLLIGTSVRMNGGGIFGSVVVACNEDLVDLATKPPTITSREVPCTDLHVASIDVPVLNPA